jgi:hypothetical protein
MARDRKIVVFVNDEEYSLLLACQATDRSLGATVRDLAVKQAQWYASKGLRVHAPPRYPQSPQSPHAAGDLDFVSDPQ